MRFNRKTFKKVLYAGIFLIWIINLILAWKVIKSPVINEKITGFITGNPEKPIFYYSNGMYKTLEPNTVLYFEGHDTGIDDFEASTNSFGLRDKDYGFKKPVDTVRIIALGDSVTFGWGLRVEDSWVKQLESLLNKNKVKPNLEYEVLNFGIAGYNAKNELHLFKDLGLKFEPDILILTFVGNDWEDEENLKIHDDYLQKLKEGFCESKKDCSISPQQELEMYYESQHYMRTELFDKTFNSLEESYKEIDRLTKENNIRVILGHYPVEKRWLDSLYNLIDSLGWEIVDLNRFNEEKKYFLGSLDRHPNKLASKEIAEEYSNQILKKK